MKSKGKMHAMMGEESRKLGENVGVTVQVVFTFLIV